MRIFLIFLSILALLFIGSISWSLINQDGAGWLKKNGTGTSLNVDKLILETWENQIRADERIKELSAMVEELAKKNGVQVARNDNKSSLSTVSSGTNNTPNIRISGKLLSLLMPTVTLSQVENKGIFDLHVFDAGTQYSTYEDPKLGLRIIANSMSYDTFLKNVNALGTQVYKINEVVTFPFRSFYLNPPKADTTVRLVIEMEGQSIGIEIPKTKFSLLKTLLLDKTEKTDTAVKSINKIPTQTTVVQKKPGVISVQVSKPNTNTGATAPLTR